MIKNAAFLVLVLSAAVRAGDTAEPFEVRRHTDVPLFGAAAVSALAAFSFERTLKPLTQDEVGGLSRNAVNGLDRSATYRYSKSFDNFSDALVDCMLAAPLCLMAGRKIRGSAKTFSVMYAEVVMLAYALPSIGKAAVKRPRPFVYNPDVPLDEKLTREARVSFFSRHTTFAFAAACFTSTVYGSYYPRSRLVPYVWAGGLAAASAAGVSRFAAGAHFPTDILTGALAGSIVGCGIPFLHTSMHAASRLSLNSSGGAVCLSLKL